MDGIWNLYNLKSTWRIYTFGILKCSEKFKVLDLPYYISICAPFVALETSKRNSISCHVFWIMFCVTVSMADVILSCRCWIFLIFSAYTVFWMYPHRKKSSEERSGLRGGQGIGPPLPIQASGNLSFNLFFTSFFPVGVHQEHCVCWEDKEYPAPAIKYHISHWNRNTRHDSENVAGDRISFGRLQSYKRCTYWNVLR